MNPVGPFVIPHVLSLAKYSFLSTDFFLFPVSQPSQTLLQKASLEFPVFLEALAEGISHLNINDFLLFQKMY